MARDEFPEHVKRALAARAGYLCSRPECRASTVGPGDGVAGVINIGKASHITAASPLGPRYDAALTADERRGIANGIWLCSTCADLADRAPESFSPGQLRAWKYQAEQEATKRIGRTAGLERIPAPLVDEEIAILAPAATTRTGEIAVLSTAQTGRFVRAGTTDFYDPEDGLVAAAHLEALESLVERGLVRHEGGVLYKLTGSGFRVGRAVLGL